MNQYRPIIEAEEEVVSETDNGPLMRQEFLHEKNVTSHVLRVNPRESQARNCLSIVPSFSMSRPSFSLLIVPLTRIVPLNTIIELGSNGSSLNERYFSTRRRRRVCLDGAINHRNVKTRHKAKQTNSCCETCTFFHCVLVTNSEAVGTCLHTYCSSRCVPPSFMDKVKRTSFTRGQPSSDFGNGFAHFFFFFWK